MLTLALPKGRLADESVELLIKKKMALNQTRRINP